jgi:hypothetical protein
MRSKKIIFSYGFASDTNNKEMKMLSEQAKKGWRLNKIGSMGLYYILTKNEPTKLTYCFDYVKLENDEKENYLEIFEIAGWSYVDSCENFHFFCAPPDTPPIVTEQSTRHYQYQQMSKVSLKMGIISTLISLLALVVNRTLNHYDFFILAKISAVLFGLFLVLALMNLIGNFVYLLLSRKYKRTM